MISSFGNSAYITSLRADAPKLTFEQELTKILEVLGQKETSS
jgi:hypothetical protein